MIAKVKIKSTNSSRSQKNDLQGNSKEANDSRPRKVQHADCGRQSSRGRGYTTNIRNDFGRRTKKKKRYQPTFKTGRDAGRDLQGLNGNVSWV
jgi:hypothetical protein